MASKIACSGLSYNHLKTVCRLDGSKGLLNIFREQSNGQPRVTKNSKIILEVVKFFNEHKTFLQRLLFSLVLVNIIK